MRLARAVTRTLRLSTIRILIAALFCAGLPVANGARAETAIRFVFDGKLDATAAPLLVALDRGYFRAEGLNVSLVGPLNPEPVEGGNDPVVRLGTGDADLGFGDLSTLLRARAEEKPAPVKAVYVVYNKPGYAVLGRKSRGIQSPGDLEGKKVGTPRRDPASRLWKVFVTASAIDASKITTENIGLSVRDPMLASGQIDAVTALSYQSFIDIKERGVPASDISVMLMADYGVKMYGASILASEKFASENADAVRGFLRAYAKGLKETIAKPQSAIDILLKRDPTLGKEAELERLRMTIRDNIQTPETKANGYGGVDPARLALAIDQIAAALELKKKPTAEALFDPSFLPARGKDER
jgi:NitT/TauT family transport system substrate-binding protein